MSQGNSYYRYRYHSNSESKEEAIVFCFIAFLEIHDLLSQSWSDSNNSEERNVILCELKDEVKITNDEKELPLKLILFASKKQILNKSWNNFSSTAQERYLAYMEDHLETSLENFKN